MLADGQVELRAQRLDLSLSLGSAPQDSSDIVARPMAHLQNAIVGSPVLVQHLGTPPSTENLRDEVLLTTGSAAAPHAWHFEGRQRAINNPAMCADHWSTLRDAAKAGLGLACLPVYACRYELASGALIVACPEDQPMPVTLYALTPSYRSTTQTTRYFLEHLRARLNNSEDEGVAAVNAGFLEPL